MIRWSRLCAVAALASVTVFVSCGSDEEKNEGSGGTAGSSGTGGSGGAGEAGQGTGGEGDTILCGTETCTAPTGASFADVTPCCRETGACGLNWAISSECLAPSLPGVRDANCDSFQPPTGQTMEGCCGPSGCGALNPFMGCVPNGVLGRPDVACNYDPTNDCTYLGEATCDGAEDCPGGQRCCALYNGTGFTDFGCYDSCTALAGDGGFQAQWRELCHAGDTCEDTALTCRTSMFLPESLTRCYTDGADAPTTLGTGAGEINCGSEVCGAGQKCCMRIAAQGTTYETYCAPSTEDCKCHPELVDGGP